MKRIRLERLAPLTGLVAAVFLVIGVVFAGGPGYRSTAERAARYFSESGPQIAIGHYFGYLSVMFLLWFAGSVYGSLRVREAGTGRLSTIAFGGAVFTAVAALAGFSVLRIGGEIGASAGGISLDSAALVNGLYEKAMGGGFSAGLAVFIGATGVAALRTNAFPRWLGWVSVLMAVLCLTPLHWLTEGLAVPWIAFVSIWIFARGEPAVTD